MVVTCNSPQIGLRLFSSLCSLVRPHDLSYSPFSLHRSFGWAVLLALFRFPFFCSSGSCLVFLCFVICPSGLLFSNVAFQCASAQVRQQPHLFLCPRSHRR